jgi:ubiquinone/menaquinone biosynthesis C-methylase UbiE
VPTVPEDVIAREYDRIAEHIFESPSMYRDTLALAPDCSGRVLDIGCGNGSFLALVREERQAVASLAGCDISPRLCEMAAQRVPAAEIEVANALRLEPYGDEAFDFAFMVGSLEHMQDHAAALQAARRVLRPGGALVVSVPNREWLLYERWRANHAQFQPVDDHWFRPSELRALGEANGFDVARVRGAWALRWSDWRHRLEMAAAAVAPPLHRKMKCVAVRYEKRS